MTVRVNLNHWALLALLLLPLCPQTSCAEVSPQEVIGWKLFFDPQLSRDGSYSCATCHKPELGFTDGVALGTGPKGDTLPRNIPTVLNLGQMQHFFWDGRAGSLEEQAVGPLTNPIEMDLSTELVIERVNANPEYRSAFAISGTESIDLDAIVTAIAAFERTLRTGKTPFDRWLAGDKEALTPAQKRGRMIFFTRGQCATCHIGEYLTDNTFHNIGTGTAEDLGRFSITGDTSDKGAFKTPSLRNWKGTEPFMHDGGIASMADVVDFYSDPPPPSIGESELDPLEFDEAETSDLLAFLDTLIGTPPDLSGYPEAWQKLLASSVASDDQQP